MKETNNEPHVTRTKNQLILKTHAYNAFNVLAIVGCLSPTFLSAKVLLYIYFNKYIFLLENCCTRRLCPLNKY